MRVTGTLAVASTSPPTTSTWQGSGIRFTGSGTTSAIASGMALGTASVFTDSGTRIRVRWMGYGRFGHSGYGSASRTVRLPIRDMLLAALPEGFLELGGRVEGFIYLPTAGKARSTGQKDAVSAPFTVTIVHAETRGKLSHLSIPFV